jgi:hypothetical protein
MNGRDVPFIIDGTSLLGKMISGTSHLREIDSRDVPFTIDGMSLLRGIDG